MSQSVDNVRVRRTRKLLREALIELIEERGFERLTVGQITERAMVSRAAFYRNYNDKYHLVEQIFDEAAGALYGTISSGDEKSPRERWVAFFEHISGYHRLYRALLGKSGSTWFANRMRSSMAEMIEKHFEVPDAPAVPASPARALAADLVPTVLAAMFVQSIIWWLEHDRPVSPREIAMRSTGLAASVIHEANTWGGGGVPG